MARIKFTKAFVQRVVRGELGAGTWTADNGSKLGLKRTPAGSTGYRVVIEIAGKTKTFTPKDQNGKALKNSATILTLNQAQDWARTLVANLITGQPAQPERKTIVPALAKVADGYLAGYAKDHTPKSVRSETYAVALVLRSLGNVPADEVDTAAIADMIKALPSAAQRRLAFGAVKRCLDHAVHEGILKTNPAAGLKAPKPPPARERWLHMDELAAVWRAAEEYRGTGGNLVRFLIAVPLRRSEAAELQWQQVDLDRREVFITPAKKTTARAVPITTLAVEVLRDCRPRASGPVFRTPTGDVFSGWSRLLARLRDRSGVADWTLHDLRRSVVTNVAELDPSISVGTLDLWLNHEAAATRGGITKVYQRSTGLREMHRAADAWDSLLRGVLKEKVVQMRRAAS